MYKRIQVMKKMKIFRRSHWLKIFCYGKRLDTILLRFTGALPMYLPENVLTVICTYT